MKKRICALFLAVMMLSVNVLAAESLSFTAKSDNEVGEITVEGNAPAPWGNRKISIVIFRPLELEGDTLLELTDGTAASDFVREIYTFDIVDCEADGSFTKTFKINGEAGYYTVRAGASAIQANTADDKEVLFVTREIAEQVLGQVNAAQSPEKVCSVIDGTYESTEIKNAEILSLDTKEGVYASYSSVVCKHLFSMKPFADVKSLQKGFEKAGALTEIETCTQTDLGSTLLKHSTLLELSAALSRDEYVKNKESVHSLIKTNAADLASYSSFKTEKTKPGYFINKMSAVAAVNNAATYEKAYKAVKDNDEFFDIDFSSYEGYSSLSEYEISKCLNIEGGRSFTKTSEIKNIVDGRIKELLPPSDSEGTQDDDYGSSGGGGGGGGGVSISTPAPIEPIVDEKEVSQASFSDVEKSHWAYESINALLNKGIINGVGDNRFNPTGQVTREQMAKMLVLAFNFTEKGISVFDDIDDSTWYAPYVKTAYQCGIINGVGEGKFGVGLSVSRQDLMVMLYRALKNNGYEFKESKDFSFDDASLINDYATEAVGALCSEGIVSGTGSNVEPLRHCTRAEAAKLIYATMNIFN